MAIQATPSSALERRRDGLLWLVFAPSGGVISDIRLRWFEIRLDGALLDLLDQADLVLVLDPPGEHPTLLAAHSRKRITSAFRSAFNPERWIEQFWRSADLQGQSRVIVAPGGWLASPDRPWPVRTLYHTVLRQAGLQ